MMKNYVSIYYGSGRKLTACMFNFFIFSLSTYISLQITILNSPNGIHASCKGSTKLTVGHLGNALWVGAEK